MPGKMIRVITADDHSLVRAGIRYIMEKSPDIRVVAEVDSGANLLAELKKTPCDVVLLDVMMPGKDAITLISEIKIRHPDLRVLIITSLPEEENAQRLFNAGAFGYYNKEAGLAEMVNAVRLVHSGKKFISPRLAQFLAQRSLSEVEALPHELLSDREYQIFLLCAQGKTLTQIGEDLCISIKTVSTYRSRIAVKTGLKNTSQITAYALKNNLV